jgi:hypothetical protein
LIKCARHGCRREPVEGLPHCQRCHDSREKRLQAARTELRRLRPTPRRKGKPTPRIKPDRVEDPEWLDRVRDLPCCICGQAPPSEAHHLRGVEVGTGKKAGDHSTIPLCLDHHRTGRMGIAFHAGPRIWEAAFGTQKEHLQDTLLALEPEKA